MPRRTTPAPESSQRPPMDEPLTTGQLSDTDDAPDERTRTIPDSFPRFASPQPQEAAREELPQPRIKFERTKMITKGSETSADLIRLKSLFFELENTSDVAVQRSKLEAIKQMIRENGGLLNAVEEEARSLNADLERTAREYKKIPGNKNKKWTEILVPGFQEAFAAWNKLADINFEIGKPLLPQREITPSPKKRRTSTPTAPAIEEADTEREAMAPFEDTERELTAPIEDTERELVSPIQPEEGGAEDERLDTLTGEEATAIVRRALRSKTTTDADATPVIKNTDSEQWKRESARLEKQKTERRLRKSIETYDGLELKEVLEIAEGYLENDAYQLEENTTDWSAANLVLFKKIIELGTQQKLDSVDDVKRFIDYIRKAESAIEDSENTNLQSRMLDAKIALASAKEKLDAAKKPAKTPTPQPERVPTPLPERRTMTPPEEIIKSIFEGQTINQILRTTDTAFEDLIEKFGNNELSWNIEDPSFREWKAMNGYFLKEVINAGKTLDKTTIEQLDLPAGLDIRLYLNGIKKAVRLPGMLDQARDLDKAKVVLRKIEAIEDEAQGITEIRSHSLSPEAEAQRSATPGSERTRTPAHEAPPVETEQEEELRTLSGEFVAASTAATEAPTPDNRRTTTPPDSRKFERLQEILQLNWNQLRRERMALEDETYGGFLGVFRKKPKFIGEIPTTFDLADPWAGLELDMDIEEIEKLKQNKKTHDIGVRLDNYLTRLTNFMLRVQNPGEVDTNAPQAENIDEITPEEREKMEDRLLEQFTSEGEELDRRYLEKSVKRQNLLEMLRENAGAIPAEWEKAKAEMEQAAKRQAAKIKRETTPAKLKKIAAGAGIAAATVGIGLLAGDVARRQAATEETENAETGIHEEAPVNEPTESPLTKEAKKAGVKIPQTPGGQRLAKRAKEVSAQSAKKVTQAEVSANEDLLNQIGGVSVAEQATPKKVEAAPKKIESSVAAEAEKINTYSYKVNPDEDYGTGLYHAMDKIIAKIRKPLLEKLNTTMTDDDLTKRYSTFKTWGKEAQDETRINLFKDSARKKWLAETQSPNFPKGKYWTGAEVSIDLDNLQVEVKNPEHPIAPKKTIKAGMEVEDGGTSLAEATQDMPRSSENRADRLDAMQRRILTGLGELNRIAGAGMPTFKIKVKADGHMEYERGEFRDRMLFDLLNDESGSPASEKAKDLFKKMQRYNQLLDNPEEPVPTAKRGQQLRERYKKPAAASTRSIKRAGPMNG